MVAVSIPFSSLPMWITRLGVVALATLASLIPATGKAAPIRLHVTDIAEKALTAAAAQLKEQGIDVKMSTEGGSSVGISALAGDGVDIAITIRGITAQERSMAPGKRFVEETLAFQALALVVPDDVWGSGIRALSRDQMTRVYEGRVKNWKELGGEDHALKFYNPTQGIGVWEPFVTWLYGDVRKASLGSNFEMVRSPEETRDSVEFNKGSISVAPPRFADGKGVFALAIKTDDGAVVQPTLEEMRSHRYPLSRPIVAIAGGKPTGDLRRVLEFLRSKEGQELFAKSGLVPAAPQESH